MSDMKEITHFFQDPQLIVQYVFFIRYLFVTRSTQLFVAEQLQIESYSTV